MFPRVRPAQRERSAPTRAPTASVGRSSCRFIAMSITRSSVRLTRTRLLRSGKLTRISRRTADHRGPGRAQSRQRHVTGAMRRRMLTPGLLVSCSAVASAYSSPDSTVIRQVAPWTAPTYAAARVARPTTAPVGAGAYTLQEYARDDHTTLVRNPGYYGTAYLDEIVIKYIQDPEQEFNTLQTGGTDVLLSVDALTNARARDAGYESSSVPLNGGIPLYWNVQIPPFDDVRARQVLA